MRSLPRSRWNHRDSATGSRCAGQMVRFHRRVVPMRETVSTLMRHEQDIVPEGLYPYFQDVYDHILRVSESSDSLRDLVTAIVETNFSLRDYRQNLIVKKVSGWAAIIAVPALITGYLRDECPLPRVRGDRRRDLVHVADHRRLGQSLLGVQTQRLAVRDLNCRRPGLDAAVAPADRRLLPETLGTVWVPRIEDWSRASAGNQAA